MPREPYIRPEVKSEVLEPEALCGAGSGPTTNGGGTNWGWFWNWSWWWK